MVKTLVLSIAVFISITSFALADTFGTGDNAFDIEFVTISGDSGDLGSWPGGSGYSFTGVNHGDYGIGTYEITNDQWTKFQISLGVPLKGSPSSAYGRDAYWVGSNLPTNNVSWYEAAQFVNFLNTSQGHQAAYKFTGTQGTSNYTFNVWDVTDAAGGTNLYRHKDAYYFLPTEDEWFKAAYWNGTSLQTYTTVGDVAPTQAGWNFYYNGYATDSHGPWDITEGLEELNGTKNMMGNIWELMENPWYNGNYTLDSGREIRGGAYNSSGVYQYLIPSGRHGYYPDYVGSNVGFRVASVPEPASLLIFGLGGLLIRKR